MLQEFDFAEHRLRAVREYTAVLPNYEQFCDVLYTLLKVAIAGVSTWDIKTRVKSIDSFAEKACKPDPVDITKPKYREPVHQITDLAGLRIIVYNLRDLKQVDSAILRFFAQDTIARTDKSEDLLKTGSVGYQSIHYVLALGEQRSALPEYSSFAGLSAEIQARTILQHAWAEMEHDIRYKPAGARPELPLVQRFTAMAGLITIADREFEQIFEAAEMQKQEILELAQLPEEGTLESEQRNASVNQNGLGSTLLPDTVDVTSPRALMLRGRYQEAITKYTQLIVDEPKQFSHYLGRAKARFVDGDVSGALSDLDTAETLPSANMALIRAVRRIIEGDPTPRDASLPPEKGVHAKGHEALRRGDGASAYQLYKVAQDAGFNPIYSAVNLSMAKIVAGEVHPAQEILAALQPFPQSRLFLTTCVLRAICSVMSSEGDLPLAVEAVKFASNEVSQGTFAYSRSVLPILEEGINHSSAFSPELRVKMKDLLDLVR